MPRRPPRPCRFSMCPHLVEPGSDGYCDEHAVMRRFYEDRNRGSSTERGYGYKWQKLRTAFLAMHPLCEMDCLVRRVVRAATEVDHIDGNSRNNAVGNLRAACKSCHSRRTLRDQVPRAAGGDA